MVQILLDCFYSLSVATYGSAEKLGGIGQNLLKKEWLQRSDLPFISTIPSSEPGDFHCSQQGETYCYTYLPQVCHRRIPHRGADFGKHILKGHCDVCQIAVCKTYQITYIERWYKSSESLVSEQGFTFFWSFHWNSFHCPKRFVCQGFCRWIHWWTLICDGRHGELYLSSIFFSLSNDLEWGKVCRWTLFDGVSLIIVYVVSSGRMWLLPLKSSTEDKFQCPPTQNSAPWKKWWTRNINKASLCFYALMKSTHFEVHSLFRTGDIGSKEPSLYSQLRSAAADLCGCNCFMALSTVFGLPMLAPPSGVVLSAQEAESVHPPFPKALLKQNQISIAECNKLNFITTFGCPL